MRNLLYLQCGNIFCLSDVAFVVAIAHATELILAGKKSFFRDVTIFQFPFPPFYGFDGKIFQLKIN